MGMLDGKNLVIIGGTAGIGLSAAKAFIREGASVVVVGSGTESVTQARQALGNAARVLQADARQPDTAGSAIEACVKNYSGLDGLYHIAGSSGRKWGDGPLHEVSLEGWNKTFEVNLTSMMLSNQAAVRFFLKNKQPGSILNIGSILGSYPSPRFFSTHAYAAAKAAVSGFTRSIASYYASQNIRMNAILPALIDTPMSTRAQEDQEIMDFVKTKQPLDGGRIGQPEDLDGLACYFMSDASRFTTGQIVSVDGGWSITEGQYA
jgi:NAD(P)-dependent dehydrogenase (short-subunit alcohol dehydrogenase family)